MVRVQSISPRPQFNNFSRDTVPLTWVHTKLNVSVFENYAETNYIGGCERGKRAVLTSVQLEQAQEEFEAWSGGRGAGW